MAGSVFWGAESGLLGRNHIGLLKTRCFVSVLSSLGEGVRAKPHWEEAKKRVFIVADE